MSQTKIEWADKVWNPVSGCTKVSEGCRNCYAERMSKRLAGRCGYPAEDPFRVTLHREKLGEPLKWRKPLRIFVNSMSDLFHADIPDKFIIDILSLIAEASHHTFMILTKRPERMRELLNHETIANDVWLQTSRGVNAERSPWPLPNLWLGVTAENQAAADERIPQLLQTPAAVRFVSVEPLLSEVNLSRYLKRPICKHWGENGDPNIYGRYFWKKQALVGAGWVGIDWVICGGETGPGARPMHPAWVRDLRDQCRAGGTPFFFKSFGEYVRVGECMNEEDDEEFYSKSSAAGTNVQRLNLQGGMGYHGEKSIYMQRIGKKRAGRELDGRTWEEFPGNGGQANDKG